ncbi:hypothetical protein [Devosia sp. SL43]|uniref:hypothetical protein n=1 Tax=Devosia sp. SL43 TaxID=2806348 RepID=UPI001F2E2A25|nr:hypothetical protein [Devosia sp. SL43]UJW84787.1 hypothetical protein IM737_15365 [Devosia sp. SL43]
MPSPLMTLARGDSLNAWALSAIEARHFPGIPAVAHDPQHYRYVNGFVDVGDLPCRVATWQDVATRTVALQTDWPVESLYLPGNNRAVEFSQFQHRPTRLTRWCRTRVASPVDRYCSFRLSTRGGVHIWVDGELAGRFEPYTRNSTEETVVHLPIKAAGSDIVVLTEDMAERDVIWFFELTLLDDVKLDVFLPDAKLGNQVAPLTALASQVRVRDEVVGGRDEVVLEFDDPAPMDVDIRVRVAATSHTHAGMLDKTLTLPAGATALSVCAASELPVGYHTMPLVFIAGDTRVDRTIGFAVLHQPQPAAVSGDLAQRKRIALDHAASHGEMRMGTAVALLETGRGGDDPRLRPIIEETLAAIEERRDCADFVSVPLLWAYMRHAAKFPDDLRQRSERALLDFRYWVDEPGNDVMWFWSENHALCFHVSQLLAGLTWPEATFTASGRTGREQSALATERLGLWFDAVEEDGLAEWNSAAYYPVDFIGLLALAELAPEPISARARALCDRIFTMVALHTLEGVPAGSMGRAYDKELRAGPLTELAPFAAVAFGKGWLNSGVAALPMFAAGRYEPPHDLARLVEPKSNEAIVARYRQGYGPAAMLTLYKTSQVQLSTNSGAKPGGYGHQQHVLDLRFAAHPMARSWVNHPGEDDPWGQRRPSYWAGNGNLPRVGQHHHIAMLLYQLDPQARIPFTHVFASRNGVEHHLHGDTLILRAGDAMVAYKATGPLEAIVKGPGAGIEYRNHGRQQGWATIVAQTTDLARFAAEVEQSRLSLDPEAGKLVLTLPGQAEHVLDWSLGLLVSGKPILPPTLESDPTIEFLPFG